QIVLKIRRTRYGHGCDLGLGYRPVGVLRRESETCIRRPKAIQKMSAVSHREHHVRILAIGAAVSYRCRRKHALSVFAEDRNRIERFLKSCKYQFVFTFRKVCFTHCKIERNISVDAHTYCLTV